MGELNKKPLHPRPDNVSLKLSIEHDSSRPRLPPPPPPPHRKEICESCKGEGMVKPLFDANGAVRACFLCEGKGYTCVLLPSTSRAVRC